jgi:hypothetical protein
MNKDGKSQQTKTQATGTYGMNTTLPVDPRNLDCDDIGLIGITHHESDDTSKKKRAEAGQRALHALRFFSE